MPCGVASGSLQPAKARAPNVNHRERAIGDRPPPNLARRTSVLRASLCLHTSKPPAGQNRPNHPGSRRRRIAQQFSHDLTPSTVHTSHRTSTAPLKHPLHRCFYTENAEMVTEFTEPSACWILQKRTKETKKLPAAPRGHIVDKVLRNRTAVE